MYADPGARGGILEPEGIVEIKFRRNDLVAAMHRLDPVLQQLAVNLPSRSSTHDSVVRAFALVLLIWLLRVQPATTQRSCALCGSCPAAAGCQAALASLCAAHCGVPCCLPVLCMQPALCSLALLLGSHLRLVCVRQQAAAGHA